MSTMQETSRSGPVLPRGRTRRSFPREFKADAVALVLDEGRSIASVARALGIGATSLGGWLLCGHIHERWRQDGKQINVGVDAWRFAPVSDDTICEVIRSGPARIPCPSYGLADA